MHDSCIKLLTIISVSLYSAKVWSQLVTVYCISISGLLISQPIFLFNYFLTYRYDYYMGGSPRALNNQVSVAALGDKVTPVKEKNERLVSWAVNFISNQIMF